MPTTSLQEALEAFLLDRTAQNLAAVTLKTYRRRLQHFVDWLSARNIDGLTAITTNDYRQYQASLTSKLADTTARNHAVDIKVWLSWCVNENLLTTAPTAKVKLPKVVERLPSVLSKGQIKGLYNACETDREKAVLLFLLDTGCRASEFCSLNVSHLDGDTVTIRDGKPRRDRLCYLSERTQRALRMYIHSYSVQRGHLWRSENGGARLKPNGLAQLLGRLGERADVHVTPHKLRRTFVTTLLKAGVNVFTLMKLSGHRDIDSLKPYVRLADNDARDAHMNNSPVDRMFE